MKGLIQKFNVSNQFRHERKFLVEHSSQKEVEQVVKFHPGFFREIFNQRQVNNIYFDTEELEFYMDNKFGIADRRKFRIRWYGELFGEVNKSMLEIKIKSGLVGDKWQFPLVPFTFDNKLESDLFRKIFAASNLPDVILEYINTLQPKMVNTYKRKYFQNPDKRFRVTVDSDLTYRRISSKRNTFFTVYKDFENIILELKYNIENDQSVSDISNQFPFRLDKSSKYVNGIDLIYYNPSN